MGTTKSLIKSSIVLARVNTLKVAGYKVSASQRTHELLKKMYVFSVYADNNFIKFQKGKNKLYELTIRQFVEQEFPAHIRRGLLKAAVTNTAPLPF